jgi:CPA2 family monovalent cation:H+ antiporter-2
VWHDSPRMLFHSELGQLALVALAALLCGLGFARFKQPAIVGYILAGVILGPSALGLVENRDWVAMLAELGVLLLLFVIAMKMSLRAFRAIWKVAMMAAAMQIVVASVVTLALSRLFGWPLELAVLLGFVVSLSSTAVAIKMLEEIGELRSETGRLVVGILIAQDLAVVPMLLLLNGMASEDGLDWTTIPSFLGAIALLAALVWYLSRRERLKLPFAAVAKRHAEIIPLTALGSCLALAAVSDFIGLTAAFGAFIGGLAIGSTQGRRRMIAATEPIQGVLAMIFFLSIGLLIDLAYIWENLATVVVLLVLVLLVKSAVNLSILRLLGEPWPRAFLAGILLSQVGEFSFVLAGAGVAMAAVDFEDHRLIVAVIALSLVVSPLWLMTARRMQQLTAGGIWRLDDLLFAIYEQEVRLLLRSARRTGQGGSAFLRRLRAISHKAREIRARRETAHAAINDDDATTATVAAEVLPPEKNSDTGSA